MSHKPATKVRTLIWVSTFINAFHHWPEAPDQVGFLRSLHRHKFGIKVTVRVSHEDRDVEFFMLQGDVNKVAALELVKLLKTKPSMSCEMMAEYIGTRLTDAHGYSVVSVAVDEDGENGGIVEFNVE